MAFLTYICIFSNSVNHTLFYLNLNLTTSPTTSPSIFQFLLIFPHLIIHFKQQYFYFKMKLFTYLKSAKRVTHTHLVFHTIFHNKQMMSLSGAFGTLLIDNIKKHNCFKNKIIFMKRYLIKTSNLNGLG